MKTIAIVLIAASVASAAMPFALAATCLDGDREEFSAGSAVLPDGTYLFVPDDADDADKVGVWSESNEMPGLQTSACIIGGAEYFPADTKQLG